MGVEGGVEGSRGETSLGHTNWEGMGRGYSCTHGGKWVHVSKSVFLHVLLFFPWVPSLCAVLSVCGGWDGVDRRALLAGSVGRMGRMGEAGPGLASVVVKLHQTENQVRRHELKFVRWVGYNKTGRETETSSVTSLQSGFHLLSSVFTLLCACSFTFKGATIILPLLDFARLA